MRLAIPFALSVLTLGVVGCATAPVPPASTPTSASSPQPVEGYDWFFHKDEDAARLAYGLAESDDLRLGLDCQRASGRLDLSAVAPAGAPAEIFLESGGDTERFRAKSEPSELNEGVFLTAQARTNEPVFLRFRREGWLAVWQGDQRQAYAPHPGSTERIEQFFAFCG